VKIMNWRVGLFAVIALMIIGASLSGTIMSRVEQPSYSVVESWGDIELRDYPQLIAAEVEVPGERKQAINAGFRMIADYIFGNNAPRQKIAMTAPVTQQAGEKIAMTAPVSQQAVGSMWKVRFIMPSRYTLDTLPTPNNPDVKLIRVPAERVAVIRYSGSADEDSISRHRKLLLERIAQQGLTVNGEPTMAFYNPPWTLPFLRRNEILAKVSVQD
jgi:effector-binding domain-containing protein